jgi:hypothetical protein
MKDYDVSLVLRNVEMGDSAHRIGRREHSVQEGTRVDYVYICDARSARQVIRYI